VTLNPLVVGRVDQPKDSWAGVWIAEDIRLIAHGVQNGSWVDGTLGTVSAGLDGLALVSDPLGALLQYGVAWIIEHVKPLSDTLDWLAGDPAQIAAHAQTWRSVAGSLRDDAADLTRSVEWDIEWIGAAGDTYRTSAQQQRQAIDGLATAADAMALMTEGAGMLIATVRVLVRDAIATVVSRLIVYAGEVVATLGAATPLVVEQVTALVAAWAAKIARWLKALVTSLRELGGASARLAARVDDLKQILERLRRNGRYGGYTGKETGGGAGPHAAGGDIPGYFTAADLDGVGEHLSHLDHSPANDAMIGRIRERLAAGEELTEGQRNFMRHELTEKSCMDRGMSYEDAHDVALQTHSPGRNYDPDIIDQYAHLFNNWWRKQWGLEPR
jgi:hypothetical protein